MLIPKTITGLRRDDMASTSRRPCSAGYSTNIISGLALEDAQRDLEEGKSVHPRAADGS